MLFTLDWSPYREYLNFLTKELSFSKKQIWHVHSFVNVRLVILIVYYVYVKPVTLILTVYYVKSNHNTDVDFAKCWYYFVLSFWSIHFFVILGVEAGQCSYVVLNYYPNLRLNVLINKVLIKKKSAVLHELYSCNPLKIHDFENKLKNELNVIFQKNDLFFKQIWTTWWQH